jgi:hypothetical protein
LNFPIPLGARLDDEKNEAEKASTIKPNEELSIEQGIKENVKIKEDSEFVIGISEIYDTVGDLSSKREGSNHESHTNTSDDLYDSISIVKTVENRVSKQTGTILDVGNLKFFSRNLDELDKDTNSDFSQGSGDRDLEEDNLSQSDGDELNHSLEVPVEDFEGTISEELNLEDLADQVNVKIIRVFKF